MRSKLSKSLFLLAGLLALACGTATPPPAPGPADTPKAGGRLNESIIADVSNFDPSIALRS